VFVVFYVSFGLSPYRRAFLEECTGVSLCTFVVSLVCYYLAVSTYFITPSTVFLVTNEI